MTGVTGLWGTLSKQLSYHLGKPFGPVIRRVKDPSSRTRNDQDDLQLPAATGTVERSREVSDKPPCLIQRRHTRGKSPYSMVILQTSDDSSHGTLHELTEVMRYERLETAELETVYEKGRAPIRTRQPAGQRESVSLLLSTYFFSCCLETWRRTNHPFPSKYLSPYLSAANPGRRPDAGRRIVA